MYVYEYTTHRLRVYDKPHQQWSLQSSKQKPSKTLGSEGINIIPSGGSGQHESTFHTGDDIVKNSDGYRNVLKSSGKAASSNKNNVKIGHEDIFATRYFKIEDFVDKYNELPKRFKSKHSETKY